jgi:hypothetical protein
MVSLTHLKQLVGGYCTLQALPTDLMAHVNFSFGQQASTRGIIFDWTSHWMTALGINARDDRKPRTPCKYG